MRQTDGAPECVTGLGCWHSERCWHPKDVCAVCDNASKLRCSMAAFLQNLDQANTHLWFSGSSPAETGQFR